MSFLSTLKVFSRPSVLIPLAFIVWSCSLWGFLSGRVALSSDAQSYYEHTRFYLEQIGRGDFPLWDPYWGGGAPNDFFLRRIGPYNPLLLFPLLLKALGLRFMTAYLIFQAAYFFIGMSGFYLLANKLFNDRSAAFLSFLLLTFSALGTRMFDSYMLLITIPLIWFFYFLVSFFKSPHRARAAGLSLALMLLLTTYIPFFSLLIFIFFFGTYMMLFTGDISCRWSVLKDFIRKNKVFCLLCLVAVCISLVPGFTFFGDAGKGGIAIPGRHVNAEAKHALAVEPQFLSPWSIMEEFFFSYYFTDLTRIAFAVVYVPLFTFLVLGIGVFSRLSRLFVLLFLWGLALLLFSMPIGFPLYNFFYQHFPFVKYFRNLHFLLWFAGLPIFVMLVGEAWRSLVDESRGKDSWKLWIFAGTAHYLAGLFIYWQGDALFSTYAALFLSFSVWCIFLSRLDSIKRWLMPVMLLAVCIQPVEVFYHLALNYPQNGSHSFYDNLDNKFSYITKPSSEGRVPAKIATDYSSLPGKPSIPYYAADVYKQLCEKVLLADLEQYQQYKIYLYDHQPPEADLSGAFKGVPIKSENDQIRVLSYSVNQIRLKAKLPLPKFIVYNDVNYPGWRLTVNGKPQRLQTSNGAFKGFWLPAGESVAVLQFGSPVWLAFNWLILTTTCLMLIVTANYSWRRRHE